MHWILGFFSYHTTQTSLMRLAYIGKIARKHKIGLTVLASYSINPSSKYMSGCDPIPPKASCITEGTLWHHYFLNSIFICCYPPHSLIFLRVHQLCFQHISLQLEHTKTERHDTCFNHFHRLCCFWKRSPARDTTAKISSIILSEI